MKRLIQYPWPGNIRELDNVIQRALVMMSGDTIQEQHILLDESFQSQSETVQSDESVTTTSVSSFENNIVVREDVVAQQADFKPLELPMDLKAREMHLILETLRQNSGHRQKTAEELNISPRTLRYKIAKLKEQGVDVP